MKTFALLLLISTPAAAGDCYTSIADPSATVIVNGAQTEPNVIYSVGGKAENLTLYGAGTGIDAMMAVPADGEGYRIEFDGKTLIFNGERYQLGCK